MYYIPNRHLQLISAAILLPMHHQAILPIQFFLEHHYPRHHVTRVGCLGVWGQDLEHTIIRMIKNRTTNGNNNKTYIYIYIYICIWLVVLPILKNMKVNGKDNIPYMKWKINKCLNPPTRCIYIYGVYVEY